MEIDLTPEQEARLVEMAKHEGMTVEDLLMAFVSRQIRDHSLFLQAVDEGVMELDRGESIPHEEIVAEMERWFRTE